MIENLLIEACPFPIVDLSNPSIPKNGLFFPSPSTCKKKFGPICKKFYETLISSKLNVPKQCPYGFGAFLFRLGQHDYAISGLVLFPRFGGTEEKTRSKQYPESHIATTKVVEWVSAARKNLEKVTVLERNVLTSHLEALHEVRRLNQTIKVIAERICNKTTSGQPEKADPDLVRAWKASELISHHLDALDLLANPSLSKAAPDRDIIFFKLIDSVYRIYLPRAAEKKVTLNLTGTSYKKAKVVWNTIHIAPSVFIDNAIKYTKAGGTIEVHVFEGARNNKPTVGFEVINMGPIATTAEEAGLFKRRGRAISAAQYGEGSGVGLITAQIIADQHKAYISATQQRTTTDLAKWSFRFELDTVG